MFCPMTETIVDPSIVAFLLSLGAIQRSDGALSLPLGEWLKQRETIASTQVGVGARRRPLLWVTYSCARCGVGVERKAYDLRKTLSRIKAGPFCGHDCATRATNVARGLRETRACVRCTAPLPSRRNGGGSQLCSDACRSAHYAEIGAARRIVPERSCEICGATYRPMSLTYTSRTCSRRCAGKLHSMRMAGAGNPGWRDGASTRREKPAVVRAFYRMKAPIMQRDGMCCVVCSAVDDLEMHHIDQNPENNAASNLVTLCEGCHKEWHRVEKSKSRTKLWPWLSEYASRGGSTTSR